MNVIYARHIVLNARAKKRKIALNAWIMRLLIRKSISAIRFASLGIFREPTTKKFVMLVIILAFLVEVQISMTVSPVKKIPVSNSERRKMESN
jgi:hypothetical protein